MLVLILVDVQYLQKVVSSFQKGLDGQNHSSGSNHLIKKSPSKIPNAPHPLTLLVKPCHTAIGHSQQLFGILFIYSRKRSDSEMDP